MSPLPKTPRSTPAWGAVLVLLAVLPGPKLAAQDGPPAAIDPEARVRLEALAARLAAAPRVEIRATIRTRVEGSVHLPAIPEFRELPDLLGPSEVELHGWCERGRGIRYEMRSSLGERRVVVGSGDRLLVLTTGLRDGMGSRPAPLDSTHLRLETPDHVVGPLHWDPASALAHPTGLRGGTVKAVEGGVVYSADDSEFRLEIDPATGLPSGYAITRSGVEVRCDYAAIEFPEHRFDPSSFDLERASLDPPVRPAAVLDTLAATYSRLDRVRYTLSIEREFLSRRETIRHRVWFVRAAGFRIVRDGPEGRWTIYHGDAQGVVWTLRPFDHDDGDPLTAIERGVRLRIEGPADPEDVVPIEGDEILGLLLGRPRHGDWRRTSEGVHSGWRLSDVAGLRRHLDIALDGRVSGFGHVSGGTSTLGRVEARVVEFEPDARDLEGRSVEFDRHRLQTPWFGLIDAHRGGDRLAYVRTCERYGIETRVEVRYDPERGFRIDQRGDLTREDRSWVWDRTHLYEIVDGRLSSKQALDLPGEGSLIFPPGHLGAELPLFAALGLGEECLVGEIGAAGRWERDDAGWTLAGTDRSPRIELDDRGRVVSLRLLGRLGDPVLHRFEYLDAEEPFEADLVEVDLQRRVSDDAWGRLRERYREIERARYRIRQSVGWAMGDVTSEVEFDRRRGLRIVQTFDEAARRVGRTYMIYLGDGLRLRRFVPRSDPGGDPRTAFERGVDFAVDEMPFAPEEDFMLSDDALLGLLLDVHAPAERAEWTDDLTARDPSGDRFRLELDEQGGLRRLLTEVLHPETGAVERIDVLEVLEFEIPPAFPEGTFRLPR